MTAWNKGLTKSDPRVLKYALKNKVSKLGQKPWNTGKKYPAPWLDEFRFGNRAKAVHNRSKYTEAERKEIWGTARRGKPISQAHKAALLQGRKGKPGGMTGKKHSEAWRLQASERMKGYSKEFFANCLRRRPMSSLEKAFDKIVKDNKLNYRFVGNGKFWIERKNPDFINTNGQKIAIELFYRRHKDQFTGGYMKWRQDRERVFGKYGWKIIFLEPSDLVNSVTIINREEVK